jgi:3-oxoacyl-[acyl-carrier protein] reductase
MNKIDLHGRVAVVTGGARGIGRAIVERFLASGAKVAIWDSDAARMQSTLRELAATASRPVIGCNADITSEASLRAALDATLAKMARSTS